MLTHLSKSPWWTGHVCHGDEQSVLGEHRAVGDAVAGPSFRIFSLTLMFSLGRFAMHVGLF